MNRVVAKYCGLGFGFGFGFGFALGCFFPSAVALAAAGAAGLGCRKTQSARVQSFPSLHAGGCHLVHFCPKLHLCFRKFWHGSALAVALSAD